MKSARTLITPALVLTWLFGGGAALQAAEKSAEKAAEKATSKTLTLGNLLVAYDGEMNAQARYTAFAKKADEEGYLKAGTLFRAAARAEEIHSKNFADAIKKLGGTAKANVKKPEVKSTKENLDAAFKGETQESEKTYPEFLAQARKEGRKDAVRPLNGAKTTEAEHAKLFKQASDNLKDWKSKGEFYVCPVCGLTVAKIPDKKCPVCYTDKEKFLLIK